MTTAKHKVGEKVIYRGSDGFKVIAVHNPPNRDIYYVIAFMGDRPYVVIEGEIKAIVTTKKFFGSLNNNNTGILFGVSHLSKDNVMLTVESVGGVTDFDSLKITKLGDKT
jgi:hypothetical protein